MTYGKRQGLSTWGKVASIVLGLFLAGCIQAATSNAMTRRIAPHTVLRATTIDHSRVRVVTGPVSAIEAYPGCPNWPCGRQTAMLPSVNGAKHRADVAIGGDFVRNGRPVHAFVHNGRIRFRGIRNGDVFMLNENGSAMIGRGHTHQLHNAEELFGGYPQVLEGGQVQHDRGDCQNVDGPDGGFCLRQPRQGIGLSRDGQTAILIQVDGRQKSSRGVLLPEFGRLFKRFGAYDALNVDGGGSSVMWTARHTPACMHKRPRGCLVSNPIYGERRVAEAITLGGN